VGRASGSLPHWPDNLRPEFRRLPCHDLLRWAVERQFMIIGEALSVLRRIDSTQAGRVPDLPQIVAFRNVLVHGYTGVDDRLVWGMIERELTKLTATLANLLATAPDQP
jgi:uncharacterized protein with HEPN domain